MVSITDIPGGNATVQIPLAGPARWVAFGVVGTGTVRIGGANVSASQGTAVVAGPPFVTPTYGTGVLAYQQTEFYA